MNSSSLATQSNSVLERVWQHGFEASRVLRYGIAIAVALAGVALRLCLNPLWHENFPFIFFYPITLFAALYSGFGPALLAMLIMATATFLWVFAPLGQNSFDHAQGMAAYILADTMIAWIGSRHRRVLSDRNEAEQGLRASEQRFRTMANGAPVMIWLSGPDKLCTWFNQQWLEFTGRTMEQELGNGWAESVHKEDFDRCLTTYFESFEARQPFTMDYRLRRHDGEWRWVLDHGVPVYEGENFAGYIGSCIDVTAQKAAADALREREKDLEAVVNRTPFMLNRCSRDLRYDFVSDAYAKMLGRTPDEIVGKRIAEIMGDEGLKTILPHVEKVLAGESVEYESGVHFHGIGVRSLHVVYTPDKDEQGNVRGWIASILDITDRKQAEEVLREALRAKDRFIAHISHELRTPLTPVLLTTEILQRNKALPQSVKSALEVIRRNVQLEAKLVGDLLDLSRAATGKLSVELRECDIHEIIGSAVRVCSGLSKASQLNLVTKLTAKHRNCSGDATRLQQVFWNLIQNAIKCTAPGGSITISSRNENGRVRVDVSDTGCGIDPATLERIFEPFMERRARTANGSQGGLGLGLAIARQIIAAHGGTLVAASEGANRGATFTVSLPAARKSADLPPLLQEALSNKAQALPANPQIDRSLSYRLPQ